MRFSSLKQTTFGEVPVGRPFWLPKQSPDADDEPVSRMNQLRKLTKTRLTARRLSRTDVDGNVTFVTAVDARGQAVFCAAGDEVYCEVNDETGK